MKWVNDWPVIGEDKDGDGKGEPVLHFKKPNVGRTYPVMTPQDSDEFNSITLGMQWQWQANPPDGIGWAFPTFTGSLMMFSVETPDTAKNLWDLPNILAQKTPADEFVATVKLKFMPRLDRESFSFVLLGSDYAAISIQKKGQTVEIAYSECMNAEKGQKELTKQTVPFSGQEVYLRITMKEHAIASFGFSSNGQQFETIGGPFAARPGRWVGAKLGFVCTHPSKTNDAGYADIDWFRLEKIQ
jgi:beta-xylosidase